MHRDVVVVGGGIIGCSIAVQLASADLKVTVVERDRVGAEASWAAAGMLCPQADASSSGPFFELCIQSRRKWRNFAARLVELSKIDVEYRDDGTLCVALDEAEERQLNECYSWQEAAGLNLERFSVDDLRAMEPAISKLARAAVFLPDDHQVENRFVMKALDAAARKLGVELLEDSQVDAIIVERGKAVGVQVKGQPLRATKVVLAAGCWSAELLQPLGIRVRVTPARGQMIAVKSHRSLLDRVVHSGGCYVVPRNDGRIVIGSTVEYAGFHKGNTPKGLSFLIEGATKLVPELEDCEVVECWSGLRPDTEDHLPLLGACEIDNLILATGHFRNGVLLAPITAELISEIVINDRSPNALVHFSVDRFTALT